MVGLPQYPAAWRYAETLLASPGPSSRTERANGIGRLPLGPRRQTVYSLLSVTLLGSTTHRVHNRLEAQKGEGYVRLYTSRSQSNAPEHGFL